MNTPLADVQTLKIIGYSGLSFFVIRELIKIIVLQINKRKETKESDAEKTLKDDSRKKINNTHTCTSEIHNQMKQSIDHFYQVKKQVGDVHGIITEKKEGVPLIYNKDLEKSIYELNNTISILAGAIKDLKK